MTDFPTQNSSELLTPMNPEISPSYDFNMTKPAKNVTYSNFSCLSYFCEAFPPFISITTGCFILFFH